ncbi:hypothetical protein [Planomonospora parontospora]|uniref:hypothetical protein n=1 Tax=Planomonospora parontospora TaxID=58119 RepID=UPI0016708742|nr:hypothetical protein [Planomonospora parontospora]GGL19179.1 hypothetical protein GCM10014719_21620 [Planomonospora parontospora subsp. antibiotica]GII15462.1 hypothetical protein Ppa05_21880 [Planomonospora parontospora subsp. antibiotica]
MTPEELRRRYGQTWIISPAVADGWYAVRRTVLSVYAQEHGLSEIRCGTSPAELARRLEEETRLEQRPWQRIPTNRDRAS